MVSRWVFAVFVILLAIQRAAEIRLSRKNESKIKAKGGFEVGADHFKWMLVLHSSWFIIMLTEVFILQRPFIPAISLIALILTAMGQGLRYAAILTLGDRWTVKIMIVPGSPPVSKGVYRVIRHPNYLGVILEILAVPLLHSAYLTSIIFSIADGFLLAKRIQMEEASLNLNNHYAAAFARKPRFLPGIWGKRYDKEQL